MENSETARRNDRRADRQEKVKCRTRSRWDKAREECRRVRINFDKPERGSWDTKARRQTLITRAGREKNGKEKNGARDVGV